MFITEQYSGVKEFELDVNESESYALKVLQELKEEVEEGSFSETAGVFAHNYLPFSFPFDRLMVPEEIYRLKLHPEKGYNCLSQEE